MCVRTLCGQMCKEELQGPGKGNPHFGKSNFVSSAMTSQERQKKIIECFWGTRHMTSMEYN